MVIIVFAYHEVVDAVITTTLKGADSESSIMLPVFQQHIYVVQGVGIFVVTIFKLVVQVLN